MKLWVNTLVWGQNYTHNFLDYVLPSLLAPKNLPALVQHVEAEYRIYTREENLEELLDSSIVAKLHSVVPTTIHVLDKGFPFSQHGAGVQAAIKPRVVDFVQERRGAIIFCSPDEIWANGSFDYIGQSLAAGNLSIMTPGYRISAETVFNDLPVDHQELSLSIEPLALQRLLLKHMHPHVGASHYEGLRCPAHSEYIAWPVADEGVLFYHLIHSQDSPSVYVPHELKVSYKGTLAGDNGEFKYDLAPADRVLCASLTSINWMVNWLHDGQPHDPLTHAKFIYWYHETDFDLMHPVRIQATDKITPELWEQEEKIAQQYFDVVRHYRNEMIAGNINAGRPPYSPSSCGSSLTPEDIKVSQEVLQWTMPVIAGRFSQSTLDYLSAKSAGDGW